MFRRVAIVHDWLTAMRGAERVLESLCALYPRADVFMLRFDPARVAPTLTGRKVTTSFIDRLSRLPLARGRFRALLPLFPMAIESFRLDGYDLVISSSHCVAVGALAPPEALHVAYMHSPMRYIWEAQAAYQTNAPGGALGRLAFRLTAHYLRLWDGAAAARPHVLVANSTYTRDRIKQYYHRESEIIEPPIDTERFQRSPSPVADVGSPTDEPGFFLVVSALVPYKRVELAVRAMAGRPERLIVVGEGAQRSRLERLAGPNVSFRGWVSDSVLEGLYRRCAALIHPAVDDFGIAMVEALAAGKPVIASREGGASDIVRPGDTGVLFDAPTVEAVRSAIDRLALTRLGFQPARLRERARLFDRVVFERRFADLVARAWRQRFNLGPAESPSAVLPLRGLQGSP
jgi:glycosyltransferase involved in cell wall biosynthesis